jgi:hypothetical protein
MTAANGICGPPEGCPEVPRQTPRHVGRDTVSFVCDVRDPREHDGKSDADRLGNLDFVG